MSKRRYTTQLQAGLGMVTETRALLGLWHQGMTAAKLYAVALDSGDFPGVSARRLQNIISECFASRLLTNDGRPAAYLKALLPFLDLRDFEQILLIYASRANVILEDFIRDIYWNAYAAGHILLTNQDAYAFVIKANQLGNTTKPWSENTIRRVASYLTGACADFGLLEYGAKSTRKILPFKMEWKAAIALAYDLHFSGAGDNMVVADNAWTLFGMTRADTIEELRRLSRKGFIIVQAAGDVIRIGWQYKKPEELANAFAAI